KTNADLQGLPGTIAFFEAVHCGSWREPRGRREVLELWRGVRGRNSAGCGNVKYRLCEKTLNLETGTGHTPIAISHKTKKDKKLRLTISCLRLKPTAYGSLTWAF